MSDQPQTLSFAARDLHPTLARIRAKAKWLAFNIPKDLSEDDLQAVYGPLYNAEGLLGIAQHNLITREEQASE